MYANNYDYVHIEVALRNGAIACTLAFSLGLLLGSMLRRGPRKGTCPPVEEIFTVDDVVKWEYRRFLVRWTPECGPGKIVSLPGIPRPLDPHPDYLSIGVRCVEVDAYKLPHPGEWKVVCRYSRS